MGTLTANVPRLAEHCPHKLATSCRLTATHNCCACADTRPHGFTYSVYIDGVGMTQRGTRWQSYCWFCKEFWNNRIAATDPAIQSSQTRIPLIPDQTEFLQRWNQFHQGYKIVKRDNGMEHRVPVFGEPMREVAPGFLPRTIIQLRDGVSNDAQNPANRFQRELLPSEQPNANTAPEQSLDQVLDSLVEEVEHSPEQGGRVRRDVRERLVSGAEVGSINPRSPGSDHRTGGPAQGLEADRPLTFEPVSEETVRSRLAELGIGAPRTPARSRLAVARERMARVFGTREDVQRDDYQSPLAMFDRADERYRQAEARRIAANTSNGSAGGMDTSAELVQTGTPTIHATGSSSLGFPRFARPEEYEGQNIAEQMREAQRFDEENRAIRERQNAANVAEMRAAFYAFNGFPEDRERTPSSRAPSNDPLPTPRTLTTSRVSTAYNVSLLGAYPFVPPSPAAPRTLDNSPDRPEPKADDDMMVKLECQICFSQIADIAVLPCGHMCMCRWCADIWCPVKHGMFPAKTTNCPKCRRRIAQRVKIYMS